MSKKTSVHAQVAAKGNAYSARKTRKAKHHNNKNKRVFVPPCSNNIFSQRGEKSAASSFEKPLNRPLR